MSLCSYLRNTFRDSHGKTYSSKNREIHPVVPDVADLVHGHLPFFPDSFHFLPFIPDALPEEKDSQFFGPFGHRAGPPRGEDSHFDAASLEKFNPLTVAHIEKFDFPPALIVGNPAIRQNPIHIKEEEMDFLGSILPAGRRQRTFPLS